tara:strand:+ start:1893 stop:2240 length:348 start_codon:yes stop_codon:yes gene_type:complete
MKKNARAFVDDPDSDERIELIGKLARQYLDEMEQYRLEDCEHSAKELREKIVSGGGIQCKPQCLNCGASVGNSAKKQDGLPKWDDGLQLAHEATRTAGRCAIQRKYIQIHSIRPV